MSVGANARRKSSLLARAFSTTRNVVRAPKAASSVTLPPEKMRALIAMYHQTETFVTRENLDDKINQAFTRPAPELQTDRRTLTYRTFEDELRRREDVPTVTEWAPHHSTFSAAFSANSSVVGKHSWSGGISRRDGKVIEALYGVETLNAGKALPGLGTLDDFAEMLEKSDLEDRATYKDTDY